jgi:hypothetical protein
MSSKYYTISKKDMKEWQCNETLSVFHYRHYIIYFLICQVFFIKEKNLITSGNKILLTTNKI